MKGQTGREAVDTPHPLTERVLCGWWMILAPHFLLMVLEGLGVVATTHSFLPGFVLRCCTKSGQKVAPSFSSAQLVHEAGTAPSGRLP